MIKTLKASAGTGKTYRLSLEYVAAILKGDNFEEIVVMTFTRKATAEIKERIFAHLEDILENKFESEVYENLKKIYPEISLNIELLNEIYSKMIKNKDKINIYTIDSFINQIFKKAVAPYLGVYNYEIIEKDKNNEIIERVFKEILDNKEDFLKMKRFLNFTVDRKIDKYISLINNIIDERWKFLLLDKNNREKMNYNNPVKSLDESIYYLEKIAEEKGKEVNNLLIKDYKDFISNYLNLSDDKVKLAQILKNKKLIFKNSFWHGNKVKGKSVKEERKAMKNSFLLFKENLAAYIFNEEMIPYEKNIFNFYNRIFEIYDNLKFREKKFTHTDISNYIYKYLKNKNLSLLKKDNNNLKEIVSDYFYELIGNEVKNLFIDEFQDTSILQWKILLPLINGVEKLIIVGDEKQSIYGWRGGEKELFANLESIIGGKIETLDTCYRSQKEILNFVNDFFLSLDKDWDYSKVSHLDKKDYGYVEVLLGGKSCQKNTNSKTFKRMSEDKKQKYKKLNEDLTVNLKEKIANKINQELDEDKEIGILARTAKDLNQIAIELDKKNIAYIYENKNSLLDHKVIKGIYYLLRYINYNDFFDLIRFMRSDFIGINSDELKFLLMNNKNFKEKIFLREEKNKNINYDYLENILEVINKLSEVDYEQFGNELIKRLGIMELYKNDSYVAKNIYKFVSLMHEYGSLASFLEFIEENKDNDDLTQVELKEENAVKLLTIHKSKGLSFESEFFYWSPGGNRGGYSEDLNLYLDFDKSFDKIDNYLLTSSRYEKYFEYLNFDFAKKAEKKALMEEINNVYVALTRAKNNLFFYIEGPRGLKVDKNKLNWAGNDNYGFYEKALAYASDVSHLSELIYPQKFGELTFSENDSEKDNEKEANDSLKGKKVKELKDLSKYYNIEKKDKTKLFELNQKKLNQKKGIKLEKNKTIGLATHYYLEHIEYGSQKELDYSKKLLLAKYGNILSFNNINKIVDKVNKFINNNKKYFRKKWEVYTEFEIKEGENTYRIDRLLVDQDEKIILILDYKTGLIREREQLENYKKVVNKKLKSNNYDRFEIKTEFLEV
ncbi:MAG: UvrD-helicase domain-containing protein [Bacillota bacterium]